MHGTTRTHAPAENASDTLVSKADPENRDATRKFADHVRGYSGPRLECEDREK